MDAGTSKQTRSAQNGHKEKTETAGKPSQNDPIQRVAKTSQSGNAFLPAQTCLMLRQLQHQYDDADDKKADATGLTLKSLN